MYMKLAKASVVVYAGMSVAAFVEGDWRRGTLSMLFTIANAIMFVI